MLLSNQTGGLFDHQYFWKESIAWSFYMEVVTKEKVASEADTFGSK